MDTRQDGGRLEKSESAFRTISEVASELDIPQHVLRFWEGKFPQIKPLKRAGGRRYYRPEDVALLRRIRDLLYGEGYTIKGVQKLLREGGVRTVAAPPVVEMGESVPDAAVDIIEEDDEDTVDSDVPVPPLVGDDDVLIPEEDALTTEDDTLPSDVVPVEDGFVAEAQASEHEQSPRIALESVLEATPDELLDLFPVVDDEEQGDTNITEAAAVTLSDTEDNNTFRAEEGDSPDLSQPLQDTAALEGTEDDLQETAFPIIDLSSSSALSEAESVSDSESNIALDTDADTILVDRAYLREMLTELETLRSLLKSGGASS